MKQTWIIPVIAGTVLLHTATNAQTPYAWKPVIAGGGGFVPGIVYHPTARGLAYTRTDIGGAYRWENGKWIPLTDMLNRNNSDYMGILSIGLDPNDTNRVYLECGKYTQSWAGTGAVLVSTNKGNSWTIVPLTVKIGGNEDGRGCGERLQVDPNSGSILFMGTTQDGLWKSTDHGANWGRVTSFPQTNVNVVIFDPSSASPGNATQRLFVAAVNTAGQSLYRSTDGGATWSPVAGQPSGVMGIRGVVADTVLYMTFANAPGPNGATAGSVQRYGIPGGTWTNISPSSGSYGFSGIAVYPPNPAILAVSTLDRWSPRDEVYASSDAGATWMPRLTTAALDHSYAPYTAGNITPHWLGALAIDPFDPDKAMFGTGYGIWGTDSLLSPSLTWYFKDQDLEETVPIQIISPPFTNLISVMGDYDGFRHDDLDMSPPDRHFPYKWTTLAIANAGRVPSKVVKAHRDGIPFGSYSTDGGRSWIDFIRRPGGTTQGGTWAIAVSADGESMVWSPTGSSSTMYYSSNNGGNWIPSTGGVPRVPPVADRVNPEKFYAYYGGLGRIWLSTDRGVTFSQGAGALPPVEGNVSATPGREGDLWICCSEGGLYRSTNSGITATQVAGVARAYRLGFGRGMALGAYPAIYMFGTVGTTLGFFRSVDSGATWTRINDDNHQFGWIHQITGDMRVFGRCYVAAEGRGIVYGEPPGSPPPSSPSTFAFHTTSHDTLRYFTQDITTTWAPATDPQSQPVTYIVHLLGAGRDTTVTTTDTMLTFSTGLVQPTHAYVLTGCVSNGTDTTASTNHLVMYTTSSLTGVGNGEPGERPSVFGLSQNYPNPFNPATNVIFSLGKAGFATLKVFDLLGREVATLVEEERPAGESTVRFDATGLSSGVYFYMLKAGGLSATRKLVVIR